MDIKPRTRSRPTHAANWVPATGLALCTLTLAMTLLGGCGSRSSPAYPPPLRIEPFRPAAEALAVVEDEIGLRIAGCRSASGGLYADLFVVTGDQQDLAPLLGDLAVGRTSELFELRDGEGAAIAVLPAERATRDYVETSPALSLAQLVTRSGSPSFGRGALAAQTYPVTPGVVIQTIPIQLDETLPEGEYHFRLTEAWAEFAASGLSPNDSKAVRRALGSSRIDPETEWVGFRVASRRPSAAGSRSPW